MIGVKEAGNNFHHFSNSFILADEFYLCLSSDAIIVVSSSIPRDDEPIIVTSMAIQVTIATIQPKL